MERLKKDVKRTAKMNGVLYPAHLFQYESVDNPTGELPKKQQEKAKAIDLFKELAILLRSVTIFYNWAVCTLLYYALTTISTTYSKNIFLNYK